MTEATAILADLARVLTSMGPALAPRGSDELLRSITVSARELFGAEACSLALLSDDGTQLVFTTASGSGAAGVVNMRIPAGQGIAGWVVTSEQPISISDLQQDARFDSDVAESTGYVPRAILAVPVVGPHRMLGVIEVLDRDGSRPGAEHDMRLLSLFADQAAIAIENSRVFADLGRAVLNAVATAAPWTDLAAALSSAAGQATGPDRDLLALAALFGEFDKLGFDERRLAISVTEDLLVYFRGRVRRPS